MDVIVWPRLCLRCPLHFPALLKRNTWIVASFGSILIGSIIFLRGKTIRSKEQDHREVDEELKLTVDQINTFKRDGVLVVPNVLTKLEVTEYRNALHGTLNRLVGVDIGNLERTAGGLKHLSSTNGSGGVLDIFYESFKLKLAESPKIFNIIRQLWAHTFATGRLEDFEHPYGEINCSRGYAYIDRVGFRIPSKISDQYSTKIGKKRCGLQRSLTPHLDCCPESLYEEEQGGKKVRKWRPIQCFVALTDTLESNSGGFEAAKGHHINFKEWVDSRQSNPSEKDLSVLRERVPCLGEFTAIRPHFDADVLASVQHIPCGAGDLVLWDNRIPHANSYKNNTVHTREVVYLGWLPDIALNREYVKDQLQRFKKGEPVFDQWREDSDKTNPYCESNCEYPFTDLGKRLMGIIPW